MSLTPDEMKERMHYIIDHEYDPEVDTLCLIYTKNGKLALEDEINNVEPQVMLGVDVLGETTLTVALNFFLRIAADICERAGMDIVHYFFRQVFPFFFSYDKHRQDLENEEMAAYFEDTEEEDYEALTEEEQQAIEEEEAVHDLVREAFSDTGGKKKFFVKNPVLLKDQ